MGLSGLVVDWECAGIGTVFLSRGVYINCERGCTLYSVDEGWRRV